VLLQGATLPEVYLLDDHQCGVGDPDPSCVPEGEDETGGGGETGDASTSGEVDAGPQASGSDEGGQGSSGGTGVVVTGLPPAEDDDEAEGCGCRGSGRASPWGLASFVLLALSRRGRGRRAR
jgi:hypothetical protein